MKILLAHTWGMCFGVRDALVLAKQEAKTGPLTVLGALVHNPIVVMDLEKRGISNQRDPSLVKTRKALVTAHGASKVFRQRATQQGLILLDSTCPLVKNAHRHLQRMAAAGATPLVIGKPGHVEVLGLTEDFPKAYVVLDEATINGLPFHAWFGVVAQTTQPTQRVHSLLTKLRTRFPQSRIDFHDTVCQPTKDRQRAVKDIAKSADLVLVVGGKDSNNTQELVKTCRNLGAQARQIQTRADIKLDWFAGVNTVGLTAGTSTPDFTVHEVHEFLLNLANTLPNKKAS